MAGPCLADTPCITLTFNAVTGTMSAAPIVAPVGASGHANGLACSPTGLVVDQIDSATVTWTTVNGALVANVNPAGLSSVITASPNACNEIFQAGNGLYSENDWDATAYLKGPNPIVAVPGYVSPLFPLPNGSPVPISVGGNHTNHTELTITNPSACAPFLGIWTVDFGVAQLNSIAGPPRAATQMRCGITENGILLDQYLPNWQQPAIGETNSYGWPLGSLSHNFVIPAGGSINLGGWKQVGTPAAAASFQNVGFGAMRVTAIGGTSR